MEIRDINHIEQAAGKSAPELLRFGLALLFVIGIMFYTWASGGGNIMLIVAGMIGGYMALNIGANDVANNVGPAVGSRALSLGGALVIAAIFEAAGALIAGGDVVSTIRGGIIAPSAVANSDVFVWLMLAALLAGAIWLNIATALSGHLVDHPFHRRRCPRGGDRGGGWGVANWGTIGSILQLDHFAPDGRPGRRRVPLFHQAPDSLPPGCHGRGAPRRSPAGAPAWPGPLPPT